MEFIHCKCRATKMTCLARAARRTIVHTVIIILAWIFVFLSFFLFWINSFGRHQRCFCFHVARCIRCTILFSVVGCRWMSDGIVFHSEMYTLVMQHAVDFLLFLCVCFVPNNWCVLKIHEFFKRWEFNRLLFSLICDYI